jgi:hypothetical protein
MVHETFFCFFLSYSYEILLLLKKADNYLKLSLNLEGGVRYRTPGFKPHLPNRIPCLV